jgi:hypothetical protein
MKSRMDAAIAMVGMPLRGVVCGSTWVQAIRAEAWLGHGAGAEQDALGGPSAAQRCALPLRCLLVPKPPIAGV